MKPLKLQGGGALQPDDPSFAARGKRVGGIWRRVAGQYGANSVNISAPSGAGKTSLLHQLRGLTSTAPGSVQTVVSYCDVSTLRGRPQEAIRAIQRSIAEALEGAGRSVAGLDGRSTLCETVDEALRRIDGRLVMSVDNFDAVASDLGQDEQTDMRQAVEARANAGWVLCGRLHLTESVEDIPSTPGMPPSYLAGVVMDLSDVLEPLSCKELSETLTVVLGCPPQTSAALSGWVIEKVGGFVEWVRCALGVIEEYAPGALSADDPIEALAGADLTWRIRRRLRAAWARNARHLSLRAQMVLGGALAHGMEGAYEELYLAGWSGRRNTFDPPFLLRDWLNSDRVDPVPVLVEDAYERLRAVVIRANLLSRRRGEGDLVAFGSLNRNSVVPHLRRVVHDKSQLMAFFKALAVVLYDYQPATAPTGSLPLCCYTDPRSPIVQLHALIECNLARGGSTLAERVMAHFGGPHIVRTPEECQRFAIAFLDHCLDWLETLAERGAVHRLSADEILPARALSHVRSVELTAGLQAPFAVEARTLKMLREEVAKRRLVPFVGSGLSLQPDVKGNFPSWLGLYERMIDACLETPGALTEELLRDRRRRGAHELTSDTFLLELDQFKEGLGEAAYHRFVADVFRPRNAAPGRAHRALIHLNAPAIITTNYDQLIERADSDRKLAGYTWRDAGGALSDLHSEREVLFKVHGCASDARTIVLTRREYDLAKGDQVYQQVMRLILARYTLLFVGYGLTDPWDLDYAFNAHASLGAGARVHFALVRDPPRGAVEQLRKKWNIVAIPYPDHQDVAGFLECLTEVHEGMHPTTHS